MWRDEETEPLASSLHLSLSAAVEHSRDTDTLLNTLKISEEARIEEQSRSMQLQAKPHAGGARSASTTAAGPSSMRPRLASALCAAGAMVLRGGGGWPSSPGAGRVCFSLDALLGRLVFGRRTKCRGEDDARR